MKFQQMHVSFEILGECGAAFHPVAAVQILDAIHGSDFRAVDVSTDYPVHPGLPRNVDHTFLISGDIPNGALRLKLQVRGNRPVSESKTPANPVEVKVEFKDPVVEPRADALEDPVEVHESVELVSVHHQIPASVQALVNGPLDKADSPQIETDEVLQKLVVVPVDVGDPGLLSVQAEQLLDDRVGVCIPQPPALEFPAINDIADEIKVAALRLVKKVEQQLGLGMAASQMDIGNPNGVVLHFGNGGPGLRPLLG